MHALKKSWKHFHACKYFEVQVEKVDCLIENNNLISFTKDNHLNIFCGE